MTRVDLARGPVEQTREDRQRTVKRALRDLERRLGDRLVAVAAYGSYARGSDGPFSDIELLAIVAGEGIDQSLEWVYGANKIEINFQSRDMFEADLLNTEEEHWAIWKGAYLDLVCLAGDQTVFDGVRERLLSPPEAEFDDLVAMLAIVVFELVGKVRNANARGDGQALPMLAVETAYKSALLLGARRRHCYTTGTSVFIEALELPSRPAGFDDLVRRVQRGDLGDSTTVVAAIDAAWAGLAEWMTAEGIDWGARVGWPLDDLSSDWPD